MASVKCYVCDKPGTVTSEYSGLWLCEDDYQEEHEYWAREQEARQLAEVDREIEAGTWHVDDDNG